MPTTHEIQVFTAPNYMGPLGWSVHYDPFLSSPQTNDAHTSGSVSKSLKVVLFGTWEQFD